jgi:putative nucleotidyltransferase with HDIG domain
MSKDKIFLLEHESDRRAALGAFLAAMGMRVEPVSSPGEAAPAAEDEGLALLVLSIPGIGSPLLGGLGELKQAQPGLPVIALVPSTASADLLPYVEHGLIDQVAGPDSPAALWAAVRSERLKADLERKAADLSRDIRRLKKEQAGGLRRALEIEDMYETTLENFMAALDLRDVETYGHSKTVARYTHVLAEALGIRDPETLNNLRKGALLHDAGKIAIPDAILKKPGPLTEEEWQKVRRHPDLGYGLIKDIKLVKEVGNIILCHHERYDGTGYPRGLQASAIPLEARIFAVADTLDAVTSHRPYRGPSDFGSARREIIRNAGGQFDPKVVDAFCGQDIKAWERIRFQTTRILPSVEAYRHLASKK